MLITRFCKIPLVDKYWDLLKDQTLRWRGRDSLYSFYFAWALKQFSEAPGGWGELPVPAFPREPSLPAGWKINVSSKHLRVRPPPGGPVNERAAGDPRKT